MLDAPKIVKLYLDGLSSGNLAKKFDVTPAAILTLLKRENIARRKSSESLRKANDSKILELYESDHNPTKIASVIGMSVTTVTNSLKRTTNYIHNPVLYPVSWPKDNMFELYYVGLLLADGCLHVRRKKGPKRLGLEAKGKTLKLTLHKQDINILKEIKKVISPLRPISLNKNCANFEIPISDDLCQVITSWGIVEKKSLILKPTQKLDNLNKNEFFQMLVGFIEGDGSIMVKHIKAPNQKRYRHLQLSITSTYRFLEWIKNKVEQMLGIECALPKNYGRSVYEWRVTGSKAVKIVSACKQSKYLFMHRKWDLLQK